VLGTIILSAKYTPMKPAFLILLLLAFSGCARNPVEWATSKAQGEGWTFFESVGLEVQDAKFSTWIDSPNSRILSVEIVEHGRRAGREFRQKTWIYHAAIFVEPSGDSFALVFRKPKL
jgi:hypothetical protein